MKTTYVQRTLKLLVSLAPYWVPAWILSGLVAWLLVNIKHIPTGQELWFVEAWWGFTWVVVAMIVINIVLNIVDRLFRNVE